jgi:hypothetical protein
VLLICCVQIQTVLAQKEEDIKWWNPAQSPFSVIEGQAWPNKVNYVYDRLPEYAKKKVREDIWDLSRNSAGLSIRFKTDASRILVRYKVMGSLSMPHMPATGVSGVDLYSKNSTEKWLWHKGKYSFGKTINYRFVNLPNDSTIDYQDIEFQLYLPLYNTVERLEIGVPKNNKFEFLPISIKKPVVVYGTSIAQGACASRTGMAWTAILQRKMDMPVVNLGFSGNGEFEEELVGLIAEIDAEVYVLDCFPNLIPGKEFSLSEVYKRIINSVKTLRQKRPKIPVLLVEHAGYGDAATNKNRNKPVLALNKIAKKAFADLKAIGIENIYLLTKDEIGLNTDSYVDGTHPSDYGMLQYASAYEKSIREILNE